MTSRTTRKYDDKEIKKIISETLESTIAYQSYQASQMSRWTSNIVEMVVSSIIERNNSYKYIVLCVITEKNGAALNTTSMCFWDDENDHSSTLHWENQTMYAVVSVFALSI